MLQKIEIDPLILARDLDGDKRLIDCPVVVRVGKFDSDAAESFFESMGAAQMTGQPIVPVVINSEGGDVYALFEMVDAIRKSKVPVATVVMGRAASAGAVLFTCGAHGMRFMSPNSSLMIHDLTSGSEGRPEEMKADVKENERLNKQLYALMESNIGKPKGHIWRRASRKKADWYLTPEEAVGLGIASKVGIPTLRTIVSVSMTLET
jgi:ATP-dependent Clp endopeptidase proteolytic subunit ClpP